MIVKMLGGVRATVFAGLLLIAGGFGVVQSVRLERAQDKIASMETKALKDELTYTRALLETERAHADDIAAIDRKYAKEEAHAEEVADKLRDDVRTGALRLRDKFSCPAPGPGIGTAPGTGGGTEGSVLSGEDQEFLVRIGLEADAAVRERNELLEIAKKDREMLKEWREAHD